MFGGYRALIFSATVAVFMAGLSCRSVGPPVPVSERRGQSEKITEVRVDVESSVRICKDEAVVSVSFSTPEFGIAFCASGSLQFTEDAGDTWRKAAGPPIKGEQMGIKAESFSVDRSVLLFEIFDSSGEWNRSAIWSGSPKSGKWNLLYDDSSANGIEDFAFLSDGGVAVAGNEVLVFQESGGEPRVVKKALTRGVARNKVWFASISASKDGRLAVLEGGGAEHIAILDKSGERWAPYKAVDSYRQFERGMPVPAFKIVFGEDQEYWTVFTRGALADEGTESVIARSVNEKVISARRLQSVEIKDIAKLQTGGAVLAGLRESPKREVGKETGVLFLASRKSGAIEEARFPKQFPAIHSVAVLGDNEFMIGDNQGYLSRIRVTQKGS